MKEYPGGATGQQHSEGREGGAAREGGMRSGTSPALLTCRKRCTNTNRALHTPRQ